MNAANRNRWAEKQGDKEKGKTSRKEEQMDFKPDVQNNWRRILRRQTTNDRGIRQEGELSLKKKKTEQS